MTYHPLLLPILLVTAMACPAPGTDTGDSGSHSETGEPLSEDIVTETGECHSQEALAVATVIESVQLSASGDSWSATPAVLNTQEELDAWQATHSMIVDASGVDFETQSILYSVVHLANTCGAEAPIIHVVEMNGAPHLSLELTNPDGTCDQVCDMTWSESKLIAVDKMASGEATVCARQIDTCAY
jgi:anti-anti-sigma regulatory factor